jgi:hypothetical protein
MAATSEQLALKVLQSALDRANVRPGLPPGSVRELGADGPEVVISRWIGD